jgi:hypothetical protein
VFSARQLHGGTIYCFTNASTLVCGTGTAPSSDVLFNEADHSLAAIGVAALALTTRSIYCIVLLQRYQRNSLIGNH